MNRTQLKKKLQGGIKCITVGEQQPLNIHLTGENELWTLFLNKYLPVPMPTVFIIVDKSTEPI
jgi:hypothetical protein